MTTELIQLMAGITQLLGQECQLCHQDAIDLGEECASPEMVMTRMRNNWLRWARGDSSRRKTAKPEWDIRQRSSEYKYVKEKLVYLAYKSSDGRLRLRLEQGYRGRLVFEIWEKQGKRMRRILAFAWEGFIQDSMPCGVGDGRGIWIHGPDGFDNREYWRIEGYAERLKEGTDSFYDLLVLLVTIDSQFGDYALLRWIKLGKGMKEDSYGRREVDIKYILALESIYQKVFTDIFSRQMGQEIALQSERIGIETAEIMEAVKIKAGGFDAKKILKAIEHKESVVERIAKSIPLDHLFKGDE